MTHSDLVKIAHRWLLKETSCAVALMELVAASGEVPDVIGFDSSHSAIIEVKVSRADFLRDKAKPHRAEGKGMGNFRYYCCPEAMIAPSEVPEKWGLIYVNDAGKAHCAKNPWRQWVPEQGYIFRHEADTENERRIMYSVLRRLQVKGLVKEIYKAA